MQTFAQFYHIEQNWPDQDQKLFKQFIPNVHDYNAVKRMQHIMYHSFFSSLYNHTYICPYYGLHLFGPPWTSKTDYYLSCYYQQLIKFQWLFVFAFDFHFAPVAVNITVTSHNCSENIYNDYTNYTCCLKQLEQLSLCLPKNSTIKQTYVNY